MNSDKQQFDIFISGGSQHVHLLKPLLRKLLPNGRVHLASCFLSNSDLSELRRLYDVLHTPNHSDDGYRNFELFSIRDINRLATAPYFIKLDADVHLEPDWIEYVKECTAAYPDAVLFGIELGMDARHGGIGHDDLFGRRRAYDGALAENVRVLARLILP